MLLATLAACESGVGVVDAALAAPAPGYCGHCARIESKRELLPRVATPGALRVYEYTVRRADGSSSVFREELPVSWRVGERLVVIDGIGPLN